MYWLRGVAVLLVIGMLSSCAMTGEQLAAEELDASDDEALSMQQLTDIQFQIEMLTRGSMCNTDLECQTIGVGTRPCGGAEYYYAYSANTINVTELFGLVTDYKRMQDNIKVKVRDAESCYVITDPGASCVNNQCILNYIPRHNELYQVQ